jgi:hypothetical protein
VQRFAPNFGDKRTHTSFFAREFLTKHNMTVIRHPPYSPDLAPLSLFSVSQLKIKLKVRHFDTIEVIEAESQAALNNLTEHYFQDAFKKMAEVLGIVHLRRRGLL